MKKIGGMIPIHDPKDVTFWIDLIELLHMRISR